MWWNLPLLQIAGLVMCTNSRGSTLLRCSILLYFSFGMYHDTEKMGCSKRHGNTLHVMTPTFEPDSMVAAWSRCSRRDITNFLEWVIKALMSFHLQIDLFTFSIVHTLRFWTFFFIKELTFFYLHSLWFPFRSLFCHLLHSVNFLSDPSYPIHQVSFSIWFYFLFFFTIKKVLIFYTHLLKIYFKVISSFYITTIFTFC